MLTYDYRKNLNPVAKVFDNIRLWMFWKKVARTDDFGKVIIGMYGFFGFLKLGF